MCDLCVCLVVCASLVGQVHEAAHFTDLEMTLIAGAINCGMTIVSMFIVDRLGRRLLLIVGAVVMLVCWVALFAFFQTDAPHTSPNEACTLARLCFCLYRSGWWLLTPMVVFLWVGWILLLIVCVYVAFFAVSWGPIPWIMQAEVFPLKIRHAAASWAAAGASTIPRRIRCRAGPLCR